MLHIKSVGLPYNSDSAEGVFIGFDELCLAYGSPKHTYLGESPSEIEKRMSNYFNHAVKIPLYQQVIDWLRENYQILVNPVIEYNGVYHWVVAWEISEHEVDTEDIEGDSFYHTREKISTPRAEKQEKVYASLKTKGYKNYKFGRPGDR